MNWLRTRYSEAAAVFGCLGVFIGLQLATLRRWDIWFDESFTAMLISYSPGEMLRRITLDVHPPLYYLLLKGWAALFGDSLTALRSFSVVCMAGVFGLSLWLVYRLAGRRAATLCLPILALSPALVRYGQEARMYGLAALLGLGATHLLLNIVADATSGRRPRRLNLLLYALMLILVIYTHYFAALLIVVHLVVFWVALQPSDKRFFWRLPVLAWQKQRGWLLSYVLVIGLLIPWLPFFWRQFSGVKDGFWIGSVSISSMFSTISSFLIFLPEWLTWRLSGIYALIMLIATVFIIYFAKRIIKTGSLSPIAKILLIGYWTIPMVILFVASIEPLTPYYYDRYFVVFAPLFYIFLGVGLSLACRRLSAMAKLLLVGFFTGCLLLGTWRVQVYGNNFGRHGDDYFTMDTIASRLLGQFSPGDVVVTDNIAIYLDLRFYTSHWFEPRLFAPDGLWDHGSTSLVYDRTDILVKDLSKLHPKTGQVWVVAKAETDLKTLLPSNWLPLISSHKEGYAQSALYLVPYSHPNTK